jgi:hypothetical protein
MQLDVIARDEVEHDFIRQPGLPPPRRGRRDRADDAPRIEATRLVSDAGEQPVDGPGRVERGLIDVDDADRWVNVTTQHGRGGCVGDDDTTTNVTSNQPDRGIEHVCGVVIEPQAVAPSLNATETHGTKVAVTRLD